MKGDLSPGMASEYKVIEELRRRNVPCRHRVQIDQYEVDILVGRRIVIEVDGYVHAAKDTLEKDQRKELYLHDQGFIVMRITGNEVRNRGLVRDFGRRIQELYVREQTPAKGRSPKPLTQSLAVESLAKLRRDMGEQKKKAMEKKRERKRSPQEDSQKSTGEEKQHSESEEELFRRWVEKGQVPDKDHNSSS